MKHIGYYSGEEDLNGCSARQVIDYWKGGYGAFHASTEEEFEPNSDCIGDADGYRVFADGEFVDIVEI